MTNIINFADLIGAEETVHPFELNGRTIMYSDPTLESIPALNKMLGGDFSFSGIYDTALKTLRGQRFKDGEPFTEAWLESIPYGDFLHFSNFIRNPDQPGDKPNVSEPAIVRGFRGHDVKLPPVTLGDLRFFGEYLAQNDKASAAEYLLEQLDRVFDDATLEDDSPLPEGLTVGLNQREAQALIRFWMNREAGETVKKAEPKPKSGRKPRRGNGSKSSPSSATPSDTPSSEPTPTT